MAFARAAALSGTGTVSCTGTTTVTGTGTNFGVNPRLGGTIIVGGVTKTVTSVASTTSLTTDTAFGAFAGQAFTYQKEVIHTGADTMGTSLGLITGFVVTNRGDQQRTFDIGGQDLSLDGSVLTIDATTGQLRNNYVNSGIWIKSSASASAELKITGRKATANNAPYPYPGLDWLGVNGSKIMQLQGSAAFPAKLTLLDACIRYGADWITTNSGQYSTITTEGEICWILNGNGSGTGQARLRLDNNTPSINFMAKKTYVGVWLNFGVPQTSLKGYTPLNTDGPEINLNSIPVATRIQIEDYDTTYVKPSYYPGAELVLLGGAWVRLKNNLKGSDLVWRSMSPSGRNVVELSKQVKVTAKDTVGNLLSDGYLYFTPVGVNVPGIRAKGMTSDITFDLSKKAVLTAGGVAETEFVYAWDYANSGANESNYEYFCSGTTKGAETHPAFVSRYGYDTQPFTMELNDNGTFEYESFHGSLPTTDKDIAAAAAITGVTFDFPNKVMDITGALDPQLTYDAYQYQRNQPANLGVPDDCVINGSMTDYVGWAMNIASGGTMSALDSDDLNSFKVDVVTKDSIDDVACLYETTVGPNTRVRFTNLV